MQKKVIGDHIHQGKMVEIVETDEEASKVRICKGYEGAGQLLWMHNEFIEWQDEPVAEEPPKTVLTPIDWAKYTVVAVVALAIIIKIAVWIPGMLAESKIKQAVSELNEINTLDATDVEIRDRAQERIDSRSKRKGELLEIINFPGRK